MNSYYFGATFFDWLKGDLKFVPMIISFFRTIVYLLAELIYGLVYDILDVFSLMINGELLDSAALNELFGRVGILLGVVMLFRIAFVFIQALIDPDNAMKDKQKGIPTVIKKTIVVILMFGMSTYIFTMARQIQVLVIKNHVIEKLLLPQEVDTSKFNGALTANLFTAFYNVDPTLDYQLSDTTDQFCVNTNDDGYLNQLRLNIADDKNFSYMKSDCLNAYGNIQGANDEQEFLLKFNFIGSILLGIVMLYFILTYTIQVGMRVIQLAVLQILSPIAFVGYLEPKQDNMFSKWLKLYISTYLDVFIRVLIIDFVFYLVALLMEGWNGGEGVFWASVGNPTGMLRIWIGVLMIVALLSFALKAPKLLAELFPTSAAGSALSLSPSLKETAAASLLGLSAAALGMGVSTVGKAAGKVTSGVGGAFGKFGDFMGSPNKGQALRDSLKNKYNDAKMGMKNRAAAFGRNPFGSIRNGLSRVGRTAGNITGSVTGTIGTLKSGWDSGKDKALPTNIGSAYHSGRSAAAQRSNLALQYMNQVDAALDGNGEIKRYVKNFEDAQEYANKMYNEGAWNWKDAQDYINDAKAKLDAKRAEVYSKAFAGEAGCDVKVQAAIENAKRGGVSIPEYYNKDFVITKDGETIRANELESYIKNNISVYAPDYPELLNPSLSDDEKNRLIANISAELTKGIGDGFKQRKEKNEAEGYRNFDPNKK